MTHPLTNMNALLDERRRRHLLRTLVACESSPGPIITVDGRQLINLSSNNYLGLATHPALQAGAMRAIEQAGCGAGASRLITGTLSLHQRIERQLAQFLDEQAALLFSSGYAANVGILPALVGQGDRIYSDARNHASIIDGCRMSRAEVRVYPHGDAAALERQLEREPVEGARLIVTESLFSMDGDLAPLPELAELAQRFQAMLLIDEAHAIGVLGPGGRGCAAACGLAGRCLRLGTLGKAFGSAGAFLGGPKTVIDVLTNTCRSFIYSTAIAPPLLGAIEAALPLVEHADAERRRLMQHASRLREGLRRLGFAVPERGRHIVPVLCNDAEQALAWSSALTEAGVLAWPIRPPTVPERTSRLRLAPCATHSAADIAHVLDAFDHLADSLKGPRRRRNDAVSQGTASSKRRPECPSIPISQ